MFRLLLINMPFANLSHTSLGLTQLQAVLKRRLGTTVHSEVLYLNHEFAEFFGLNLYSYIACSQDSFISGLGEWFYRQIAYPYAKDNTDSYFNYYYNNMQSETLKSNIIDKRKRLDQFMDDLIEKYALHKANLLGFTSMFYQSNASIAMARKVKKRNPQTLTVMGGANCDVPMGEVIAKKVACIDYVFSGTALRTFPQFVASCINHDVKRKDTSGNFLAGKNNSIRYENVICDSDNSRYDFVLDEELDYESFFASFERHLKYTTLKPCILFQTSRGCWWAKTHKCTFCSLNVKLATYHAMDPQTALRQFRSLYRHVSRCTSFQAVDNVMPKNYSRHVFPFLNTPRDTKIFYEIRVGFNERELQAISSAGVVHVQAGIESLNSSTLKLLNKGTTAFQNLQFLMYCLLVQITPEWNLLVGVPGDDERVYQNYQKNIPKFHHLPPPVVVSPINFSRYSKYFDNAKLYGLDLQPFDYYKFAYPLETNTLYSLAYNFSDSNNSSEYSCLLTKWFDRIKELVYQWQEHWFKKSWFHIPKLFMQKEGRKYIIFDSRQGTDMKYPLSTIGRELLELLNKPRTESNIFQSLCHLHQQDLETELAYLKKYKLVYKEGEYLLSLVLKEKPRVPRLDILQCKREEWRAITRTYS